MLKYKFNTSFLFVFSKRCSALEYLCSMICDLSLLNFCRSEYPQLGTQGSWGSKNPPMKGNVGGSLNRQKSNSARPVEHSLSSAASSTQSSVKGKKNALTKRSGIKSWFSIIRIIVFYKKLKVNLKPIVLHTVTEAVDFKEWCESECIRLVGSKGILSY